MAGHIAILGIFVADATFRTDRLPQMGETVIGESVALSPGGKGSNQSVAAARLGADVRFISRVGRDAFADLGFAVWADAGVEPMVARSERTATGGRVGDGECGDRRERDRRVPGRCLRAL